MILLDSIADVAVKISTLFMHHFPNSSLELFGAVEREITMGAVSWLFVY